jgi:hypothetical protein
MMTSRTRRCGVWRSAVYAQSAIGSVPVAHQNGRREREQLLVEQDEYTCRDSEDRHDYGKPGKPKLSNAMSPVTINQMANKSITRVIVNFMLFISFCSFLGVGRSKQQAAKHNRNNRDQYA